MTQTQAIRPSLWWAALAIPFFLVGLGLMIFVLVTDIQRVGASMASTDLPGQMDLDLKRDLSYTIFLQQRPGGIPDRLTLKAMRSEVRCKLYSLPNGEEIPLRAPAGSTTYNYGSLSGVSFLEFRVPRDATYMLGCQLFRARPGPKLGIAVGAGAEAAISNAVVKSIVSLVGGSVVGLLIFVRVLMLRDQSRRAIRALGLKPM